MSECDGEDSSPAHCSHDYENFKRKGRARYHCPKCDADISFDVVMLADAGFYDENSQALPPGGSGVFD